MNRRDAIKNVALLLGGTLSAPTLMAMSRWEELTLNTEGVLFSLTEAQRKIVAEVAEMIIPKTDTVGAKDVGVPAFIEMMMKDCYAQPEHLSFMEGVTALEQAKFLDMDASKRTETLTKLETDTKEMMKARQVKQTKMGDNDDKEDMKAIPKGLPFWRLMKELTLLGYFTSEAGLKASFEYVPIPTKLEVIKLKPNQKAYAY
ncbi:MAG: gluconate 2-dehydrogenase subunit 3 family protein [Saprospiraceae bacterium]|nr:gluconate 2-dehydrogenase subunit 3 family protein [Saprospiraceae bacterium]